MKDIFGLGKVLPIDKLIDIVSRVTGRLAKAYFDRKDIDTKAYEIKKLAEAKADEMKIISSAIKENYYLTGGIEYSEDKIAISSPKELPNDIKNQAVLIDPTLEERTNERVKFSETKKQLNIETVTAIASEQLRDEPHVTDEPLNEDWTTRFFNIVEDISDSDMQSLWGRILAGEVKQPNSYSLRTLEVLRNLTQKEAKIFTKLASLALVSDGVSFVLNSDGGDFLSKEYQVSLNDRQLLAEAGLINATDLGFSLRGQNVKIPITFGKYVLLVERRDGCPEQNLRILAFSNSGSELLKLIEQKINLRYFNKFAEALKNEKANVFYASILEQTNENIKHTTPILLPVQ